MRPRTLVAAGVATAALVTAGTVMALYGPARAPSVAPAPSAPATVEISACGLPGTPGVEGAASATWTVDADMTMPVSPTDGPGVRTQAGPWSCFAHTQSGAVLAGYVIAVRSTGAQDWQAVVREQTMPGPGQAVLLGSVPNTGSIPAPKGFEVAAFDPSRATIRYRLSTAGGEFSCTTDVQWSAGDWRLVLLDDGSNSSGCTRGVPDAFTPWGP